MRNIYDKKVAMNGRKAFTVEANEELSKEFEKQRLARGYTKYRAIEGALRLWLTLSPLEQVKWIEGNPKPVFSDDPTENEILVDLDNLARAVSDVTEKIARAEAPRQAKTKKKKSREA